MIDLVERVDRRSAEGPDDPVTSTPGGQGHDHALPRSGEGVVDEQARPTVFISHSTQDQEIVEKELIEFLENRGVDTWYSRDDIQSADDWQHKIIQGLRSCDWFLVVMSQSSARSEWVKDELHWAIGERHGRIIPVLIEDCDPLDFHIRMARIQFVDFRESSDQARRELLGLLRR